MLWYMLLYIHNTLCFSFLFRWVHTETFSIWWIYCKYAFDFSISLTVVCLAFVEFSSSSVPSAWKFVKISSSPINRLSLVWKTGRIVLHEVISHTWQVVHVDNGFRVSCDFCLSKKLSAKYVGRTLPTKRLKYETHIPQSYFISYSDV